MGKCKGSSDCETAPWCRGYCAYHYNQWRAGNLDVPFVPARGRCAVEGCDSKHISEDRCHHCDEPHRSKGLCERHYFRHLRGTPVEPVRAKIQAKLTPDDVRQIRHLRREGNTLRVIAAKYGVSMCAVSAACKGRTWADVD